MTTEILTPTAGTEARKDNLKSVRELIAERPDVDITDLFERMRGLEDALWEKLTRRLTLEMDASTASLQPYTSLDGAARGWLAGYSGGEIDWAVKTWIGNPSRSFCNLHITVWLGPATRTPHLAIAMGAFPVTFFLLDYIPRVDVRLEPDYLHRYLGPVNERFLELQKDQRLMPFISQSLFVRAAVSPIGLNFISQPGTQEVFELLERLAHEHVDRWLPWLDEAAPVPEAERAQLAANDLALRRNVAELDPANIVVEKLYGKELTDRLVRGLWGGDRLTPRPI
jgi:hypothetical protein